MYLISQKYLQVVYKYQKNRSYFPDTNREGKSSKWKKATTQPVSIQTNRLFLQVSSKPKVIQLVKKSIYNVYQKASLKIQRGTDQQ